MSSCNSTSAKTILLGITGGIAAYKMVDLVSRLRKRGYQVEIIMTESARHLVAPLALSTLSGRPVRQEMFHEITGEGVDVEHISLAEKADLMAIIPATANIIGKAANGIADDLLSTTILAAACPVLYFPAMNTRMWEHAAVQRNLKQLKNCGYDVIEPAEGFLACGAKGKGRLGSLDDIEKILVEALEKPKQDLKGRKVLISAGPTYEYIDAVRFIANRSSGKMGYALAKAALRRGAEVTLVSGPVSLNRPEGVKVDEVVSAVAMGVAMERHYYEADIVIMAAAVADYRLAATLSGKLKKTGAALSLSLEENPDILKMLGEKKENQFLVGFAAETDAVAANALKKLRKKNLDMIVANDLTKNGAGFDVDTNIVTIYTAQGDVKDIPLASKETVAETILDEIVKLRKEGTNS